MSRDTDKLLGKWYKGEDHIGVVIEVKKRSVARKISFDKSVELTPAIDNCISNETKSAKKDSYVNEHVFQNKYSKENEPRVTNNMGNKIKYANDTITNAYNVLLNNGTKIMAENAKQIIKYGNQHYSKLPKWMKDNQFILDGYRPELKSFSRCLLSILSFHTETINIWSHMIGFFVIFGLMVRFFIHPFYDYCGNLVSTREKNMFLLFFLPDLFCLGSSTLFHVVTVHSKEVHDISSRLDYIGIIVHIWGFMNAWLYFGFQGKALAYYMFGTTAIGIVVAIIVLHPKFHTHEYNKLRATLFVMYGLSAFLPIIHQILELGMDSVIEKSNLYTLVLTSSLYIFGAAIYVLRIPEKVLPGYFDIFGNSHQIFHVVIVLADLVSYYGINDLAMRCKVSKLPKLETC